MRSRNGHIDDGTPIKQSIGEKCPNCGSSNYKETISLEKCSDCGLEMDYWGNGGNEVYEKMLSAKHRREELEREDRIKRQLEEEWGPSVDWDD